MGNSKIKVRKAILKKLFKHRYIGGRHTEIRNAIKGFPPEQLKEAKKQVILLIKKDYLISKPSTGEVHVSLNPRMIKKIIDGIFFFTLLGLVFYVIISTLIFVEELMNNFWMWYYLH